MIRTTLDDAETHLRELIAAALRGEEVLIETAGEQGGPAVRLVATELITSGETPTFGSAKGLIWVADNFDDPLEDFDDYQ